ncbi:unnamed protein product [Schistosoma curassoni]|uniref:Ig-like domain-containing protein n=1 Tax=Schistosoma curassoni TaxID=6186 RepID=A0A183JKJ9_9TREM|nr:unnamed protein product [Schistosoma curassoni]
MPWTDNYKQRLNYTPSIRNTANNHELTYTCSLMLTPPSILRARYSIHRTFNIAEVWWTVATWTGTTPPVSAICINFIMKCMVNLDI